MGKTKKNNGNVVDMKNLPNAEEMIKQITGDFHRIGRLGPVIMKKDTQNTPITLEEVKRIYHRFQKLTPQEILQLAIKDKPMEEVTVEDLYKSLFLPRELLIDRSTNRYITINQLVDEGKLESGDLAFFAYMHTEACAYENKKDELLATEYLIRKVEAEKIMELFPPSNHVLFMPIAQDEYGTLYGKNLWRFSRDVINMTEEYTEFIQSFNKKFDEKQQSEIFHYVTEEMIDEFVFDEEVKRVFKTIVRENTKYKIAQQEDQTGKTLSDREKQEIYSKEYRDLVFENIDAEPAMDVQKMLLSISYRYLCDITLQGEKNFQDGSIFQQTNTVRDLLSLITDHKSIHCQLSENDFTKEQLESLLENGLSIQIDDLDKHQIIEMMEDKIRSLANQAKEQILQDTKTIYQYHTSAIESIEFSTQDVASLLGQMEMEDLQFLMDHSKSFLLGLKKIKEQPVALTQVAQEMMLKLGLVEKDDLIKAYLDGTIEIEDEALSDYVQDSTVKIQYWQLISDYERIRKISNENEKAIEMNRLKRKINLYLHSLGEQKDEVLADESYTLIVNRSEEYEDNKKRPKKYGFSKEMLKDLYQLRLVTLESVAAIDTELLDELFQSDLPDDLKITPERIIQLYQNGDITGTDIKKYWLEGILPSYFTIKLEDINLTVEEARELFQNDRLNPKNILLLYQKGLLTDQDLSEKVDSFQTEEEKYFFIYGSFAEKEYDIIFEKLIDKIHATQDERTATGLGSSHGIGPGRSTVRNAIPSKLRWKFLASLDQNFAFETLPDGHVAYIFPSYDKVLVEKMREIYKGQKCDAYGKASYGMSIADYQLLKPRFVLQNPKNPQASILIRPNLVALQKQYPTQVEAIPHYPTTWGGDVVEYIYQQPIQQIPNQEKRDEIEFLVEELTEEIKAAKAREKE